MIKSQNSVENVLLVFAELNYTCVWVVVPSECTHVWTCDCKKLSFWEHRPFGQCAAEEGKPIHPDALVRVMNTSGPLSPWSLLVKHTLPCPQWQHHLNALWGWVWKCFPRTQPTSPDPWRADMWSVDCSGLQESALRCSTLHLKQSHKSQMNNKTKHKQQLDGLLLLAPQGEAKCQRRNEMAPQAHVDSTWMLRDPHDFLPPPTTLTRPRWESGSSTRTSHMAPQGCPPRAVFKKMSTFNYCWNLVLCGK